MMMYSDPDSSSLAFPCSAWSKVIAGFTLPLQIEFLQTCSVARMLLTCVYVSPPSSPSCRCLFPLSTTTATRTQLELCHQLWLACSPTSHCVNCVRSPRGSPSRCHSPSRYAVGFTAALDSSKYAPAGCNTCRTHFSQLGLCC